MRLDNERGAALITALLVMASFSLLTAAIVFTVQTEVQISANYKYGQQAYHVANAGVQKSLSWFNTAYVPHTPASDYAMKVPVKYNGGDVTLSGKPGVTSNYPDSATSASFYSNLGDRTLQADSKNTGAYQASATLLRSGTARLIDPTTFALYYGNLERWRLDSIGFWGISANPIGRSEVSAVIEKQAIPFFSKAMWVDDSATFQGGSLVDSYDPTLGPYGGSNIGTYGDIGSNGDIKFGGSKTTINGGVWYGPAGTCTNCSDTNISGQVSQLVQKKVFPPIAPFAAGTQDVMDNHKSSINVTLGPGSYGTIDLEYGSNVTLTGGTYYIDSLVLSGQSTLTIAAGASVTLYVKTYINMNGGTVVNTSLDPTAFQLIYSGTNTATLNGGGGFYGTVYAPNALLKLTGNAEYYGSFIAYQVQVGGGANIHYDSDLLRDFLLPKPFRIITWTQKNF